MAFPSQTSHTLLSDLLTRLGVPYTQSYTARRFVTMPFRTLFGLKHLLNEYGVDSEGLKLADVSEMAKLPVPFLAQTCGGAFVIVSNIDSGHATYITEGEVEHVPVSTLIDVCTGTVLLTRARMGAQEPDYKAHRRKSDMLRLRNYGAAGIALFFLIYLFVAQRIWSSLSASLVMLFDIGGLALSVMLAIKGLGLKNRAISRVCGVLQEGGCDTVLADKASKFFIIFSWSEVGLAYFGVSLLTLLIWPLCIPELALCNLCCLPFTVWSIWYQHTRARAWCTLCVSVQCTLWVLFFCYLGGGWVAAIPQVQLPQLICLGAAYVLALLCLNMVNRLLHIVVFYHKNNPDNE